MKPIILIIVLIITLSFGIALGVILKEQSILPVISEGMENSKPKLKILPTVNVLEKTSECPQQLSSQYLNFTVCVPETLRLVSVTENSPSSTYIFQSPEYIAETESAPGISKFSVTQGENLIVYITPLQEEILYSQLKANWSNKNNHKITRLMEINSGSLEILYHQLQNTPEATIIDAHATISNQEVNLIFKFNSLHSPTAEEEFLEILKTLKLKI
jgi:hypothetical protein